MPAFLALSCVQGSGLWLPCTGWRDLHCQERLTQQRGAVVGTFKQCGQVKVWRKDGTDAMVSGIWPTLGLEMWLSCRACLAHTKPDGQAPAPHEIYVVACASNPNAGDKGTRSRRLSWLHESTHAYMSAAAPCLGSLVCSQSLFKGLTVASTLPDSRGAANVEYKSFWRLRI